MNYIKPLLSNENLRDVLFGLGDIPRKGWLDRGIPTRFVEDDFTHSLSVEKGNYSIASRKGFDLQDASVQGFIHEFSEYIYGDHCPGEVDENDKHNAEKEIIEDICAGMNNYGEYLFSLWLDFDLKKTEAGKNCFFVDKSITTPASVAYRNNIDSIVTYYDSNPNEFSQLLKLPKYENISKNDVYDAMLASLDEFHPYAKKKTSECPVFTEAIDTVVDMKTTDVGKIFDTFYGILANKHVGNDFYIDRMTKGSEGLYKMKIPITEVKKYLSK